jgi:hypothetical protein
MHPDLIAEQENDRAAVAILSDFASEITYIARIINIRQTCEEPVARTFHGFSADREMVVRHIMHATQSALRLLFSRGLVDPASEAAFAKARLYHQPLDVSGNEFRHGMVVFVTSIMTWIRRFGWRTIDEADEKVLVHFFKRVGQRIGVTGLPEDFAGYARLYAAYRQQRPLCINEKGKELFRLGLRLEGQGRPRILNCLATQLYSSCLDPDCCRALGLRRPNRLIRAGSEVVWRLRCRLVNCSPIVRFAIKRWCLRPPMPRPAMQPN